MTSFWPGPESTSIYGTNSSISKTRRSAKGFDRTNHQPYPYLIHASDSPEAAQKELQLIFKPEEIFDYKKSEYDHVYTGEEMEG